MQENKINEEEDTYLKVTVRLSNLRTLYVLPSMAVAAS